MTDAPAVMPTIYAGWHTYQSLLIDALAPLTPEQLALSAAPGLRSIHSIATHIIGARARWFERLLGEGGQEFVALGAWDRAGQPARTAAELVSGLWATWGPACTPPLPAGRPSSGRKPIPASHLPSPRCSRASGSSGT